jgi:hypothetical protein
MSNVLHTISVALKASITGKAVFGAVAADLSLIELKAGQAQRALSGINKGAMLAVGGLVAMGAGFAVLKGLKVPLDAAEKWQTTVAKLSLMNMGDGVNADAIRFAKGMNIVGSTYTDNLRMMTEAVGVFRDAGGQNPLGDAKMVAPMMAKLAMIDSSLDDTSKSRYHHQELAMLRFAEISGGLTSPQRMQELLNSGFKAVRSSGGNVDWEGLRQFKTRAGAAGFNLTDNALFGLAEPIIGELKGSTAGTGLRTAFRRAIGALSIMPRNSSNLFQEMGLWDPKLVQNMPFGVRTKGNPLLDTQGFSSNPFQWYEDHVHSYYEKHNTNATDRIRDNELLFGSTGANVFNLTERQWTKMQQSVMAQAKMLGINGSYDTAKGTIAGLKQQAATNFENLMITLGTQLIPLVTKGLQLLNPALKGLADFAKNHPMISQALMVTTALGSAILLIGGGAAAIVGGFMLLAPAFAAVGAAVGPLLLPGLGILAVAVALGGLAGGIAKFVGAIKHHNDVLHQQPGHPATTAAAKAAAHKQGGTLAFWGALGDDVISWWDKNDSNNALKRKRVQIADDLARRNEAARNASVHQSTNPVDALFGRMGGGIVHGFLDFGKWLGSIDATLIKQLQENTKDNLAAEARNNKLLAQLNKAPPPPVVNVYIDGQKQKPSAVSMGGLQTGPTGFNGARSWQSPGSTPKR